ncbi:hypothetical protein JCM11251_004334 [Rhodosporidiobolus azoricus]
MFYYACRLVTLVSSLLYPTYASYKVLRLPSGSAEQRQGLERWLMFWCVMCGVWVWEEVGEWGVGWFPFYYEIKTLAILWLVLPQIQGSTYLYTNHLSPFLTAHESDIDTFVANLRSSALALGASYIQRLIRSVKQAVLGAALAEVNGDGQQPGQGHDTHGPNVLADPPVTSGAATPQAAAASTLASLAGGFIRQYAPAALRAGQALMHPNEKAGGVRAAAQGGNGEEEQKRRRREELERELAILDSDKSGSPASSASGVSVGSSADGLRDRSRTPSSASTSSSGIPSSLSPGSTPKDPVAQRVLSGLGSLAGSAYEELTHAEASEFKEREKLGAGERRKSSGWFGGWGAEGEGKGGKDA